MMMGLHFMGEVPFRDVYIHALVRDAEGQKMSKSKGNVVDPLEVMERYGTDALRFTLAALAAQGRDIRLSSERIEGYRNFANKLWNAARFVLSNLEGYRPALARKAPAPLAERWIKSRLVRTVGAARKSLPPTLNEAAESSTVPLARVLRLVPRVSKLTLYRGTTPRPGRARRQPSSRSWRRRCASSIPSSFITRRSAAAPEGRGAPASIMIARFRGSVAATLDRGRGGPGADHGGRQRRANLRSELQIPPRGP